MTDARTVPYSLDEAMEQAGEWVSITSGDRETSSPYLMMVDDDNKTTLAMLAIPGGGAEIAEAARTLVFQANPRIAVLMFEAWRLRPDLSDTDPDYRRVSLGEIPVSDTPRDKRSELAIAYGETRADETQYRMWSIDTNAEGKRTLTPLDYGDGVEHKSRFHPLFLLRHARAGMADVSGFPQEVRLQVAMLSDDEKDRIARAAVAVMLLMGYGRDSREHQESRADSIKSAMREFLTRAANT